MDKREKTRPLINLTAKGLLEFFAEGYASSNREEGEPLDDVLIDGASYDLERLESAIAYDISQARSQAYEDIAAYIEGKGGVIPGASVYAKVVSRNEMPAISGDDRDRLNKWDRHAFDRATEDLCRAIRKIGQEHNTP